MKKILFITIFFIVYSSILRSVENDTEAEGLTFVIVHGATGGGWDWKVVAAKLTSKGHTVYRPTLTGLGEKSHLAGFDIRLTTHVDDVVNLVKFEQLNKVVLVGHSYGGMVITGVMDRIPDKIAHGIFLDAAAPDHGMSALDVWGGLSADTKVENGLVYFPWLEESTSVPKDVPHPYGTLTEKVSYDNPNAKNIHVTFVNALRTRHGKERRREAGLQ